MSRLRPVLILIGFTAVVAQIVLMRELLVLFGGTEISLGLMFASWLAWTAFGSGVLGRLAPRNPRTLLAALDILIALVLPSTILGVRLAKGALQTAPGEMIGPAGILLSALIALGPFCMLSGWLFTAGSRLYSAEAGSTTPVSTGTVYLLEAAGSAAGGILASVLLIPLMSPIAISLLLATLNLLAACWLLSRPRYALVTAGLGALLVAFAGPPIEAFSLARLWRPFDLIAIRNSVYGNLVLAGREGGATLYENGLPVFTVPDPEAAENAVHYALLEHPAPKTLLLIGGGVNGSLAEALKHPSLERVDYVELDPVILELAKTHFASNWLPIERDPRVRIHNVDGRRFVKTAASAFDVIIVNLSDPQTAQLNRFYTLEFFREAGRRLAPGGVLSLDLTSSENYISPERAALFRCIHKTLSAVFPEVRFLPGDSLHLFASNTPGTLVTSSQALLGRLRSRGIQTSYVSEAFLPFDLTPDRTDSLAAAIRPLPGTPLNRDFTPVAYYFDAILWSTGFDLAFSRSLTALAGAGFGICLVAAASISLAVALLLLIRRHTPAIAGYSVLATGFTQMGLEILLLLGFQATYGYVYQQLAIVIAMFMAGMSLGSWLGLRARASALTTRKGASHEDRSLTFAAPISCARARSASGPFDRSLTVAALFRKQAIKTLAIIQIVVFAAPLALCLILEGLSTIRAPFLFPLMAASCGLLGGYQFAVASRVFFAAAPQGERSPGALYALDLAGSCLGAILFSALLIPLFGFRSTALVMAVVSLAPLLPAWMSARRTPAR